MSDYDHDPADAVRPPADEASDTSEQGTPETPGRQRGRARPRRRTSRAEASSSGYGETNAGPQGVESGDAPADDVAANGADANGASAVGSSGQLTEKEQPADDTGCPTAEGESVPQPEAGTDAGAGSLRDDGNAEAGVDETDYAAHALAGERPRRQRNSRRRRTGGSNEPGEISDGEHGARGRRRGDSPSGDDSPSGGQGAVAEQLTMAGERTEPQPEEAAAPKSAGRQPLRTMKEGAARGLGGLKEKLRSDAPEGRSVSSCEEYPRSRPSMAVGRELLTRHSRKAVAGALLLAAFGYLGLGGPLPFDGSSVQPQHSEQGQVPDQPAGSAGSADPVAGDETGDEKESGGSEAASTGSGNDSGGGAAAEPKITDTNKSFKEPALKDGEATIDSGDRSWEGSVKNTSGGEREVIIVRGPTNASFETGLSMPSGEMTVGAFTGRMEGDGVPEGTEYRATYNRFDPSGEDGEVRTHGEYFISGEDGVIAQGSYVDRREGGEKVVRTYTDSPDSAGEAGRTLSVAFEAPEDALVPELVGYEVAGQGES